jgi:hypothetical protein
MQVNAFPKLHKNLGSTVSKTLVRRVDTITCCIYLLGQESSLISFWTLDRIFKRANKFLGIFGEICLPQLDPEFSVTPESLVGDWTNFWIGWSASNKNVNNDTSIPRVPPCATYCPMMWLVNGLSWTVFGEVVSESMWVRRCGLVEGFIFIFSFYLLLKFPFSLLTW